MANEMGNHINKLPTLSYHLLQLTNCGRWFNIMVIQRLLWWILFLCYKRCSNVVKMCNKTNHPSKSICLGEVHQIDLALITNQNFSWICYVNWLDWYGDTNCHCLVFVRCATSTYDASMHILGLCHTRGKQFGKASYDCGWGGRGHVTKSSLELPDDWQAGPLGPNN